MLLTRTQAAVLAFLEARIAETGVPPTQLEICAAFNLKQNSTANFHLRALEGAGYITREPGRARSIRLTRGATSLREDRLELPVLGRVAAGLPIGADVGGDTRLVLDPACFRTRPDYLLRVTGQSMRDAGIWDGDLVAVKRAQEARNGEIVVARIDDEITIKRFELTPDAVLLHPRNPDFDVIVVAPDADFSIEGLYCGLVRRD